MHSASIFMQIRNYTLKLPRYFYLTKICSMLLPGADAAFPRCPIRNILSRIGDKWTMLVLYTLEQKGAMRFNDLYRRIPDISQKMLTATLKTLTEDGLISRTLYPEVPPKVEYALTERGRSLLPHLDSLIGWAIENFDGILASRHAQSRRL